MNVQILRELSDAYEKASYFLTLVKQGIDICENFLNKEEAKNFRRYYDFLKDIQ